MVVASSHSQPDPLWAVFEVALIGGLAGAVLALGQWLPLRISLGPPAGRWIGVSALAGAVCYGAVAMLPENQVAGANSLGK